MQGLLIYEIPSFVTNLKTYGKHDLKEREGKKKTQTEKKQTPSPVIIVDGFLKK